MIKDADLQNMIENVQYHVSTCNCTESCVHVSLWKLFNIYTGVCIIKEHFITLCLCVFHDVCHGVLSNLMLSN